LNRSSTATAERDGTLVVFILIFLLLYYFWKAAIKSIQFFENSFVITYYVKGSVEVEYKDVVKTTYSKEGYFPYYLFVIHYKCGKSNKKCTVYCADDESRKKFAHFLTDKVKLSKYSESLN
jgi:hypothetical protein